MIRGQPASLTDALEPMVGGICLRRVRYTAYPRQSRSDAVDHRDDHAVNHRNPGRGTTAEVECARRRL